MGRNYEKQKEMLMKYIHPSYEGMYKDKDTGEFMARVRISIDDNFMDKICKDLREYYVAEHKKRHDKKLIDIKSSGKEDKDIDMIEIEKIGNYICNNIYKALREL